MFKTNGRFIFALCLAALLGETATAATVLLSDDFDGENASEPATNYSGFANFNVTAGAVDLIGSGATETLADFFPGNGLYVDMDGTSNAGGTLESKQSFDLQPGVTYTLQFDLGNSDDRFGGTENENVLTFSLAPAYSETISRDALAPFETITREITVATPTTATLVFQQDGGDNLGVLIDNVTLSAVPEPATGMLAALACAALARRRSASRRGARFMHAR